MINENFSKITFYYFLLAILPTIIMGFLNISTYNNIIIWIWDVIMIIGLLIFCILKKIKLHKKNFFIVIMFLGIIGLQIIAYYFAISNNLVNKLYTILPAIYFVHFICSYVLIGGQKKTVEWNKFFKFFIVFVVFACLYNFIINLNKFSSILSFNNKYLGFSSFFNHRNGFGQLLFFGIVSNVIILSQVKERKYYISLIFMLVNLILTFSRTSILSTFIFFFIYFSLNMFSKKENKSTFIAIICIACLIVGTVIILNNNKLIQFIDYYIFRAEDGLSGRDTVWKLVLPKIEGRKLLTGYGLGSSSKILETYGLTNSHNSIIEILLTGGIPFLIFYIVISINIFKNVNNFYDKKQKKIYKSFLIGIIVYIMFEKVLLFSTGYAAIMFTIFLIIIPKLTRKRESENE